MNCHEFFHLFEKGRKRFHLIGTEKAGVVAGLDLEGRLFAVLDGVVLNRVNPEALLGTSTRDAYLNPGGDGLWPAPEGSCLGYEYATGKWRVPPGLSGARYWVAEFSRNHATIRAEVDLVNANGLGLPVAFSRKVAVAAEKKGLTMTVLESIEYLGTRTLDRTQALLAPWTLAQFDCDTGCEVVFPAVESTAIRDLYDDPSDAQRRCDSKLWHTRTDGSQRYQIGIAENVDWIEFRDPHRGLRVRRSAEKPAAGLSFIDIADQAADRKPAGAGVRFSVYSDTKKFMEIEAAGGSPDTIKPGTVTAVTVKTVYRRE